MIDHSKNFLRRFVVVDQDGNLPISYFSVKRAGKREILLNYIPKEDVRWKKEDVKAFCVFFNEAEAKKKVKFLEKQCQILGGIRRVFSVKPFVS